MKLLVRIMSAGLAVLAFSGGAWAAGGTPLDLEKIESANTPADHEVIAKAYEAQALSLEKMAEMHKNSSQTYATPGGKPCQAAQAKHCDSVATSLNSAAQEDRALAAEHRNMAKETGHQRPSAAFAPPAVEVVLCVAMFDRWL